jgi:hypothetical protein
VSLFRRASLRTSLDSRLRSSKGSGADRAKPSHVPSLRARAASFATPLSSPTKKNLITNAPPPLLLLSFSRGPASNRALYLCAQSSLIAVLNAPTCCCGPKPRLPLGASSCATWLPLRCPTSFSRLPAALRQWEEEAPVQGRHQRDAAGWLLALARPAFSLRRRRRALRARRRKTFSCLRADTSTT